jgi:hypothetical protein
MRGLGYVTDWSVDLVLKKSMGSAFPTFPERSLAPTAATGTTAIVGLDHDILAFGR